MCPPAKIKLIVIDSYRPYSLAYGNKSISTIIHTGCRRFIEVGVITAKYSTRITDAVNFPIFEIADKKLIVRFVKTNVA